MFVESIYFLTTYNDLSLKIFEFANVRKNVVIAYEQVSIHYFITPENTL